MPKVEKITWRELTGNKFIVSLCPEMLSDAGYVKPQLIRKVGYAGKTMFNVVYDSEYVVTWISKRICKRLLGLSKQKVLEIVSNAWDSAFPNSIREPLVSEHNN